MDKSVCICQVTVADLVEAGLGLEEANELHRIIEDVTDRSESDAPSDPREVWRELVGRRAMKPEYPHKLHQLVYYSVYKGWDSSINDLPLYWFPSL